MGVFKPPAFMVKHQDSARLITRDEYQVLIDYLLTDSLLSIYQLEDWPQASYTFNFLLPLLMIPKSTSHLGRGRGGQQATAKQES